MCASLVHSQGMVWLLDPNEPFAGHVEDGGRIVARVSPGCWGAMITPDYPSGHEVTRPIAVEGAEPGDAVILRIRKINVLSLATTSGTDAPQEGHFDGDPFVAKKCPSCGEVNPQTYVEGIGEDAVRCKKCGTPVHPFKIENGYTLLMDENREIGITVNKEAAEEIAKDAASFSAIPQGSCQYSANLFAKADLPGVIAPLRPMVGNIGSCPAVRMPASHNAGDFGSFLVGAPHAYALDEEDLEKRTDGHMDVNEVVEGTALVVPVKVPGAGIYVGDVHAMMGDGEIAGHTTDVSASVRSICMVLHHTFILNLSRYPTDSLSYLHRGNHPVFTTINVPLELKFLVMGQNGFPQISFFKNPFWHKHSHLNNAGQPSDLYLAGYGASVFDLGQGKAGK